MLTPVQSGQFRRDVKLAKKRGNLDKLKRVLELLLEGCALAPHYKDHPLRGDWQGYRDLNIEPDWLLIDQVVEKELRLARTGTHADLFRP